MKKTSVIIVFICITVFMYSQDAAIISDILNKKETTLIDFSYFIASESGIEGTLFENYVWCDQFDIFPFGKSPNSYITPKQFSFFMMNLYSMKGGMMWSIFQNQRYAWKELKADNFWAKGINPDKKMSGQELIRAISKFYSKYTNSTLKDLKERPLENHRLDTLIENVGRVQ